MPKTAIIAGSTGLVGSHCLRYLFASPDYSSVTALVRRSTGIADPKLREQIVVNFDKLDDLPAADDVFCGLGTTIRQAGSRAEFRKVDFEYVVSLAERSLSKGANSFLRSHLSARMQNRETSICGLKEKSRKHCSSFRSRSCTYFDQACWWENA
jgi:uncharacterized protein YbjT (DUF2867 family)